MGGSSCSEERVVIGANLNGLVGEGDSGDKVIG